MSTIFPLSAIKKIIEDFHTPPGVFGSEKPVENRQLTEDVDDIEQFDEQVEQGDVHPAVVWQYFRWNFFQ